MYPWLAVWAPHLNFPWSGSVAQTIDPSISWFFDAINLSAGIGRVEQKIFDKASYGKQLGWVIDVLEPLAEGKPLSKEAKKSLKDLKDIKEQVSALKKQEAHAIATQVAEQMEWLQKHSPAEFALLSARLQTAKAAAI
ncbi:hypothetical protein [Rhodoferax sp.]|uniref:hypothetical protein n=1 Tax=Rhodoferax sp. TaxID=50421 RepID=UPI00374CD885